MGTLFFSTAIAPFSVSSSVYCLFIQCITGLISAKPQPKGLGALQSSLGASAQRRRPLCVARASTTSVGATFQEGSLCLPKGDHRLGPFQA